jgi:hypothetical protein
MDLRFTAWNLRSILLFWRIGRVLPHAPRTARAAGDASTLHGCGLLGVLVTLVAAVWSGAATGSDTVAVSQMGPPGGNTQYAGHPVVAYHSQLAEFMVAWDGIDDGQVVGETEIFVRRMHRTQALPLFGQMRVTALGGIGNLNAVANRPQLQPVQPCVPLVCWMLLFQGSDLSLPSGSEPRVFVLPLSADGLPAAEPRPISRWVHIEKGARFPLLIRTGTDGPFMALWVQREEGGGGIDGYEIYVRRLLPDATTPEVPVRVSGGGGRARSVYRPAAAFDSNLNEVLVVWQDRDSAQTRDRILARFIDPAGMAVSPVLPLATCAAEECFGLALAHDPGSGRYLLLWIEVQPGVVAGSRHVMAMAIDAVNGPLGPAIRVSSDASWTWRFANGANSGDTGGPAIAWLPRAQRFAALWKEAASHDEEGHMVGVRLKNDLTPPFERFVISDQTGGRVQFADIAFDPVQGGSSWAVWTADDMDPRDYEVWARQLPVTTWRQQVVFASSFEQ